MSAVESETFPEIYERHHDAIRGYLRARVRDDALAEDLTAETFARAFAAQARFVDQGHGVRPWLFTIATNLLRDELRAGTRREALLARLPADVPDAPEPAGPTDPVLAGALRELRREELEVLLLSAWADLSYEEIAEALDVPVGTVRSRLHRARKHLRKALAAGAVAGIALVAVLAVLPGRGGGDRPFAPLQGPAAASAREACATPGPAGGCLRAMSAIAGLQQLPGAGDVLYERGAYTPVSVVVSDRPDDGTHGNHVRLAAARTPFRASRWATEERWIAPDGSGRFSHQDGGKAQLDSPQDVAAWKAAGSPDLERLVPDGATERPLSQDVASGALDGMLGANGLDAQLDADEPLEGLEREPGALAAQLQRKAWQGRVRPQDDCPRDLVGCDDATRRLVRQTATGFALTLLAYPDSPQDLRAALVAVLSRTPGTRTRGLTRLPDGTRVAAIAMDADHAGDGLDVVAFDPETGALRGEGMTGEDGAVRWLRTTGDVRARVEGVGDRP